MYVPIHLWILGAAGCSWDPTWSLQTRSCWSHLGSWPWRSCKALWFPKDRLAYWSLVLFGWYLTTLQHSSAVLIYFHRSLALQFWLCRRPRRSSHSDLWEEYRWCSFPSSRRSGFGSCWRIGRSDQRPRIPFRDRCCCRRLSQQQATSQWRSASVRLGHMLSQVLHNIRIWPWHQGAQPPK